MAFTLGLEIQNLECGGKRSATSLWIGTNRQNQSAVAASLCRRTPYLRFATIFSQKR